VDPAITTELQYSKEDIVWLGNLLEDLYKSKRCHQELSAWVKHVTRQELDPQKGLKKLMSIAFSTRTLQLDAYQLIFKTPLEDIIPYVADNGILSAIATWRLMLGR
jgi:hypothetical protein